MNYFNKPEKRVFYKPLDCSAEKRKVRQKFFSIVAAIVGVFTVISTLTIFIYVSGVKAEAQARREINKSNVTVAPENIKKLDNSEHNGTIVSAPRKTNFLITGVDKEEHLTDVILVGCFDSETKDISLISIPRDTYVTLSKNDIRELQEAGRYPPLNGVMKINAIHSYAGNNLGMKYLKQEIEEILGININYYAKVNLEAFRSIVDGIGGVDMDIPKGGLYYEDPYQDLVIAIPEGPQHLMGKDAEGLVRFRRYKRGDIQRIEVQQQFLKELFKQALDKDVIKKNAKNYISTVLTYVETDFNVLDVPKYLRYVSELKPENIVNYTLPGEPKDINGVSFYSYYEDEAFELAYNIFYSGLTEEEKQEELELVEGSEQPLAESSEAEDSEIVSKAKENIKIQVLNGGTVEGLANEKAEMLRKEGFTILKADTFVGTRVDETRIMTREKIVGKQVEKYFKGSNIEIDPELPEECDIIIILGRTEN